MKWIWTLGNGYCKWLLLCYSFRIFTIQVSLSFTSLFSIITFCEPLLPFLCAIELIHWSPIFLSPCICWHIPVNAALSFIDYNYKFLSILFQISIAHHVLFQSVCACLPPCVCVCVCVTFFTRFTSIYATYRLLPSSPRHYINVLFVSVIKVIYVVVCSLFYVLNSHIALIVKWPGHDGLMSFAMPSWLSAA